ASRLASWTVLAMDNPRSEDPSEIMQEIVKGFEGKNYEVIFDRREAIEKALNLAQKDDVVLIAGKGHEDYQIFKDRTIHFDDREVVRKYLRKVFTPQRTSPMMAFSISQILKATGGKLISGPRQGEVLGISTNSKKIEDGELFIAIKGEHFDGHDFVEDVVKQGVKAVIISKKKIKSFKTKKIDVNHHVAFIAVDDPVKALGNLARFHRHRFSIPVIAITGSAGKTTTKEMVAKVLESRFRVLKNMGTENNFIGVPQTLLKLQPSHQVVVLEVGTNQPGDIAWLTHVVNPDIAIFTNIGESHLERLKSPEKVFEEKSQLVRGMKKTGTVILNIDDRFLKQMLAWKRFSPKLLTFGIENPADFQAKDIRINDRHQLEFQISEGPQFSLPTTMRENIYNALAAICCGRICSVEYPAIVKALSQFSSSAHRQEVHRFSHCWVIDDSYNANPVSFRSAVNVLDQFPSKGKRILVCADMLELGRQSKRLHQAMGEEISRAKIDVIFAYGKFSEDIVKTIRKKKTSQRTFYYRQMGALHRRLLELCHPEDVILVKGSRGMRMEKTVEFLKEKLK
ncbi:MAG: UDP-N-acetylmuramoyl-tripeptide--D-alanyl-D-alanine ligase, partial [Candidatus Omnitrophica bacterium]|nr:UDP-N-acetylmuramoyl-tripeptide--D-alanyl-D-alanine ligase [Candidatus Omnitrophota bacterium]